MPSTARLLRFADEDDAGEEIQRAIAMNQKLRERELLTGGLKRIEKAALSTELRFQSCETRSA